MRACPECYRIQFRDERPYQLWSHLKGVSGQHVIRFLYLVLASGTLSPSWALHDLPYASRFPVGNALSHAFSQLIPATRPVIQDSGAGPGINLIR